MSAPAAAPVDKQQGKGKGKDKDKGKGKAGKKGQPRMDDVPEPWFVQHRVKMWDECAARRAAERKAAAAPIDVTLPDGKVVPGVAHETTPLDVANGISEGFARKMVIAKADGVYWDLRRPLVSSCQLQLFPFDSPEGKHTFWHSSAHVLGQAMEAEFGCNLCIGPPLEDGGFYYDCEMGERKVTPEDFKKLESRMTKLTKGKHPFDRLVLTKQEALDMFKGNPFKEEIIQNKIVDGTTCTVYRCGPLIDLCKGPHVPDTGKIKAFSVVKNSSAYWLGDAANPSLQRVYGIAFPDKKQLKEWKQIQKLAAERDHRKLGVEQKLFVLNSEVSPGCAFFLPHGTRIYNKLQSFIRDEYRKRGFDEVISPNVFNVDLWKTSGHYANYKDNMFLFDCEGQEFGMKPMNCPGHCMIFKSQLWSYRDLPIRLADFGALHRNELSGALSGLTRVRRFQQDDAHIFCRQDQIREEISGALDFLDFVYSKFGFNFSLCLSTRPKKFLGAIEEWDQAETALAACLDEFGREWQLDPGEGAFYGPKIDILLTDALQRKHQCATIQLDFQLPQRFNLSYKAPDGTFARPVIVHRAILGSVERMFAVLIEHTGGKWPFWLSPRQACVVPVAPELKDYAVQVRDQVFEAGWHVDVDDGPNQFKKKIRDAQVAQYNFILVVGRAEMATQTVNVRTRDNKVHGTVSVPELLQQFADINANFQ